MSMSKYLIIASYTSDGIKGVLEKGGVARREAVEKLVQGAGGKVDSFHFAFGGDDVYVVADLPDNATAAAIAMRVSASGLTSCRTVVLLTPEEIDRASGINIEYQPPGR
jgi:uncharacterized protein with GYD domain